MHQGAELLAHPPKRTNGDVIISIARTLSAKIATSELAQYLSELLKVVLNINTASSYHISPSIGATTVSPIVSPPPDLISQLLSNLKYFQRCCNGGLNLSARREGAVPGIDSVSIHQAMQVLNRIQPCGKVLNERRLGWLFMQPT